jgi:hypothetical protein
MLVREEATEVCQEMLWSLQAVLAGGSLVYHKWNIVVCIQKDNREADWGGICAYILY